MALVVLAGCTGSPPAPESSHSGTTPAGSATTPAGSTITSPTGGAVPPALAKYADIALPPGAVPDSTLLPAVPAATWTPADIAAVARPHWGAAKSAAALQPGPAGALAFEQVLQDSGIAVVDVALGNKVTVEPRTREHRMTIQAGQVVAFNAIADLHETVSLQQLLAGWAQASADPQLDQAFWRGYLADLLATAQTPSELAWRDYLDPTGTLAAALKAGADVPLSLLQLVLIACRATGDTFEMLALLQSGWVPPSSSGPPSTTPGRSLSGTPSATSGGRSTGPESSASSTAAPPSTLTTTIAAGLRRAAPDAILAEPVAGRAPSAAADFSPCSSSGLPDWVFTAVSLSSPTNLGPLVRKLIEDHVLSGARWSEIANDLEAFEFGDAVGWAGFLATLLNFLAARAGFNAEIDDPTPLTRTKLTTEDSQQEQLSATFTESPSPNDGVWNDCLRFAAAMVGLDASLPDPDMFKGATVRWSTSDPGIFPAAGTHPRGSRITTVLAGDSTTVTFAAAKQKEDKTSTTVTFDHPATVTASVSPESAKSVATNIAQWTVTVLELVAGIAAESPSAVLDAATKIALALLDNLTDLWSASTKVPITDWALPWIEYQIHVTQHKTFKDDGASCGSTYTDTYSTDADLSASGWAELYSYTSGSGPFTGSGVFGYDSKPTPSYKQTITLALSGSGGCGDDQSGGDPCITAKPLVTTDKLVGVHDGTLDATVDDIESANPTVQVEFDVTESASETRGSCPAQLLPPASFLVGYFNTNLPPHHAIDGHYATLTGPWQSTPKGPTLHIISRDAQQGLTIEETVHLYYNCSGPAWADCTPR